jgi:hypothetical protein
VSTGGGNAVYCHHVVVQRKAQQNFGVGVNGYSWVGREEFTKHDAAEGGEEAEVYGNKVSPVLIGSFCVPFSQLDQRRGY